MIRTFYSALLVITSPLFLYSLYKKKEGKPAVGKRWKEHFGFTPPLKDPKPPLWFHAVSVGEVLASTPFIKQLKKQHPTLNIVLTTTTSTGAEQAAKLGSLVEHRYMPLDFSFAVKKFIKVIKPQQLIIMETELWPNTLALAAQHNIPITIINARLSERSFLRYQKIQWIFNLLSKNISLLLCQTQEDADRFMQLGIKTQTIHITGSIKFDINISDNIIKQGDELRKKIGTARPVWIAASTHQGEDEQILHAHKQLLMSMPNALLIIVPRHPERFKGVLQLAIQQGFNSISRRSQSPILSTVEVYLADTMGEMLTLISASDVCFMAGSLIGNKVGGHNVLEPAALSKPILTGPSYYNFKEITEKLIAVKACSICLNKNDIALKLQLLLQNSPLQKNQGKMALQVVADNRGSIQGSIQHLFKFI
ncbi:lipid IV(A) 3-deoxy-D-manno-octulosonic acid transferase [Psychromonas hadalis]|uniref:lipid IV(A) 3-deoxy-D-manno-octulosonic acid transferase n=1 Tax=Psychromonas hadalis TaxID=211669 RepID=UPI0003B68E7D|nr:lipid IV(A) 3-deoxy-D-manno-octulosonic acid transferase [Psychromonas hadalis]